VNKTLGEIIYAGGRQTSEAIELEVVKPVSQSYLTQLGTTKPLSASRITACKLSTRRLANISR
jgi:Cu+-exporting ATPase